MLLETKAQHDQTSNQEPVSPKVRLADFIVAAYGLNVRDLHYNRLGRLAPLPPDAQELYIRLSKRVTTKPEGLMGNSATLGNEVCDNLSDKDVKQNWKFSVKTYLQEANKLEFRNDKFRIINYFRRFLAYDLAEHLSSYFFLVLTLTLIIISSGFIVYYIEKESLNGTLSIFYYAHSIFYFSCTFTFLFYILAWKLGISFLESPNKKKIFKPSIDLDEIRLWIITESKNTPNPNDEIKKIVNNAINHASKESYQCGIQIIDDQSSQISQLKQTITSHQNEISKLKREIRETTEENIKTSAILTSITEENKNLKELKETLEKEAIELRKNIDQKSISNADLINRLKSANNQNAVLTKQNTSSKNKISKLTKDLKKQEITISELNKNLTSITDENKNLTEQKETLEKEAIELRKNVEQKSISNADLINKISILTEQNESLSIQLNKVRSNESSKITIETKNLLFSIHYLFCEKILQWSNEETKNVHTSYDATRWIATRIHKCTDNKLKGSSINGILGILERETARVSQMRITPKIVHPSYDESCHKIWKITSNLAK